MRMAFQAMGTVLRQGVYKFCFILEMLTGYRITEIISSLEKPV